MLRLADALVDALIALDVRYVFGVSGANIEHVHDAIHRRGGGRLTSVFARSEVGAAFMADVRARVHRTMGVCCATSGGAMMNLAVGIAESYAESVPLLALVGQPPTRLAGRGAFQDTSGIGRSVDAVGLFRPISKCVLNVTRPEDFWPFFKQAVIAAQSDRKGPAVLIFPRDVYDAKVPAVPPNLALEIAQAIRPAPVDAEAVRAMLGMIRAARHPVLILGQGVRRSTNPGAVAEFARATGMPVITTMSARAEFDNSDPLYLGTLGVAGHPSVHDYLRATADLLVLVGASLSTMTRAPFAMDPVDLPAKKLVAVNVDAGELCRILESPAQAPSSSRSFWPGTAKSLSCVLEADAGVAFEALLELWRNDPFRVQSPVGYARSYFKPCLAPPLEGAAAPRDGSLLQSDALAILQGYVPHAGHVLYDAGNCAATALHHIDVDPGVSATIALGMGGMGYAIAGAIGAQLGSPPGTYTMVFTGDGAFLMTGFELHTAVELRLPILFVVFNNAMHGMCVTRQQIFFNSRIECARYAPVDFATVARGIAGPDALWVGTAESAFELYERVEDYFCSEEGLPGVLDLRLPQEELPPFVPFLSQDAPRTEQIVPSIDPPPSSRAPRSVRWGLPPRSSRMRTPE